LSRLLAKHLHHSPTLEQAVFQEVATHREFQDWILERFGGQLESRCVSNFSWRGGCVSIQSSERRPDGLVQGLGVLFAVAVLVNYPWERLQSQLYVGPGGSIVQWRLCLAASLVDGLFVLLIFGVGWMAFGRREWFKQPGIKGYVMMLASGVMISIGVEWTTVYVLCWWTYGQRMPLVPGLGIGVTLLIQMLVLPPFIFHVVTKWNRYSRSAQLANDVTQ